MADTNMYEDSDRCPKCGQYPKKPWEGTVDPFENLVGNQGGGQSHIIYTQTGGPLLVRDEYGRPDFVRARGY
jgi:hypothetical protein